MRIDFHTHAFPDPLADRALRTLLDSVKVSGLDFFDFSFADGTASGLLELMDKSGVDRSVLLPVATKPSQCEGINRWTQSLSEGGRIIPFGAVYPDENAPRLIEQLAENGRRGIKLHGDFQHFYADEPRMLDIYRRCADCGLIVAMHAGLDCESPDDIHVTPERMANVLDRVTGVRFMLAHMGGVCCEERAARVLGGAEDLWVDTAYAAGRLTPEQLHDYISAFGSDRVLFASDSPWNDPADIVGLIESAGLSDEERERIYHKNAEELLG